MSRQWRTRTLSLGGGGGSDKINYLHRNCSESSITNVLVGVGKNYILESLSFHYYPPTRFKVLLLIGVNEYYTTA